MQHYVRTLATWRRHFLEHLRPGHGDSGFDDRFIRMWEYYLALSRGRLRDRPRPGPQIVFEKRRGLVAFRPSATAGPHRRLARPPRSPGPGPRELARASSLDELVGSSRVVGGRDADAAGSRHRSDQDGGSLPGAQSRHARLAASTSGIDDTPMTDGSGLGPDHGLEPVPHAGGQPPGSGRQPPAPRAVANAKAPRLVPRSGGRPTRTTSPSLTGRPRGAGRPHPAARTAFAAHAPRQRPRPWAHPRRGPARLGMSPAVATCSNEPRANISSRTPRDRLAHTAGGVNEGFLRAARRHPGVARHRSAERTVADDPRSSATAGSS